MKSKNTYILITSARNEENVIAETIESVCRQNILPEKWVIVSDGSIDQTDHIIQSYADKYPFIDYFRLDNQHQRTFQSKAFAIREAYGRVKNQSFAYIGILDADITFQEDYYQRLIGHFERNPSLGIAGGLILEKTNLGYESLNTSLNSVSGAVQFFRRQCFEDIGNYLPLKYGGIDAAAEINARMKGWMVKTYPDIKVYHPRKMGGIHKNPLRSFFNEGRSLYMLGYHPLFFVLKSIYRVIDRPHVLGSIALIMGYFGQYLHFQKRPVTTEFIRYVRNEQRQRIWGLIFKPKNFIRTSRTMNLNY